MVKTVKKPAKKTAKKEDEIVLPPFDYSIPNPELGVLEIKAKDEPVGEVLEAKEVIATETESHTDKRGIYWSRVKGSQQEFTGKYCDEAGVRYVTKKNEQGTETWYSDDGKTKRYMKTKSGREMWFDNDGKPTRSKTPDGKEILFRNGERVATIQWSNDGKTGTAYFSGIRGECKIEKKPYGAKDKEEYKVSNENYTYLDNLVVHKNGGYESLPTTGATKYRANGTLQQIEVSGGNIYYVESDGKTIKSSKNYKTGETTYFTGGGVRKIIKNNEGGVTYSFNSAWHKTHSVDNQGTTTYYNEDNVPTRSVDKKGNETYYAADGKTVDHTIDKKGKITYYMPDGKTVDKEKTKTARQMVDDKAKQTAILNGNNGQQKEAEKPLAMIQKLNRASRVD